MKYLVNLFQANIPYFYTIYKNIKKLAFVMFSGVEGIEHWLEMC